jgi:hypothetical protein
VLKKFLKEYRIEAIAVLLALVGVFLLVEQLEIRATLRKILTDSTGWIANLARTLLDGVYNYILGFSLSDLVGWVLIFSAAAFIIWRFRYHYLRSARWRSNTCPRCGSSLHRIRRSNLDRLLTKIFLPHAGRYLCANSTCRWSGLRHRNEHHKHDHGQSSSPSQASESST